MGRDQAAERVAEEKQRARGLARAADQERGVVEVLVEAAHEAAPARRLAVPAQIGAAHRPAGGGERARGLVVAREVLAVTVQEHHRAARLAARRPRHLVQAGPVGGGEGRHADFYITYATAVAR